MTYRCKWFQIEELVPEEIYNQAEKEIYLWWIFDDRALFVLDMLREEYGKMLVNDWIWGGERHMAGFRPWGSEVGSTFSQHHFGRAFDVLPQETQLKTIRDDIRTFKFWWMKKITGLELKVSWLHFDIRNNMHELITFSPT